MVYSPMWQCNSCLYLNDEWDSDCARCSAARGSEAAEVVEDAAAATAPAPEPMLAQPAPQLDSSVSSPSQPGMETKAPSAPTLPVAASPASPATGSRAAEKEAATTRTGARFDRFLTGLIVVCIFGLVVVAWLAVQSGFVKQILGQAKEAAEGGGGNAESPAEVLPTDPLDSLADKGVPKLRLFREYARVLRETDAALQGHSIKVGSQPGTLDAATVQWVDGLVPLADGLIVQYHDFEAKAAANPEPELEPYKVMLREQFAARMLSLLEPVAQSRSRDIEGNLQSYMIGDKLIAALEQHAQIDSSPLKDRWLAALHDREQLGLDLQNAEVYKQLEARLAALTDLHKDYSNSLAEAPAYKIRNGYIDATAGSLLDLYNDLAVKIEEFTAEFEQYVTTLDPALDSDRRKELIRQFLDLAQEDHEYAFTETYKIYCKDKELSHPAYLELGKRVAFVRSHWPDLESRYRVIYTKYELSWDRRFRDSAGTNGSEPPTDWSQEEGAEEPPADDGADGGSGEHEGGAEEGAGGGSEEGGGGETGGNADDGEEAPGVASIGAGQGSPGAGPQ